MTGVERTPRLRWLIWIDRFNTLLAAIGGVIAIGMMVTIVLDVVGRFFWNRPLAGTLDLVQYSYMSSLVALGLGYALLRGEHIRVTLLTSPAGSRAQRIVEIGSMAITLLILMLLLWSGLEKAEQAMHFEERAVGAPWLLIWPFRWVVVLGITGLLLQTLAVLTRAIVADHFVPDDAEEPEDALAAEENVFDELGLDSTTIPLRERKANQP